MKLEIDYPEEISPQELDRRLARGWFRSGPVIFAGSVLHVDDQIRQLVHLRVRLDLPDPSRSRRRLLRRNRARYRCTVGPARVDAARERLYALTSERFLGLVPKELHGLALGEIPGVFDTREVCVFDGDTLVAVSYFDLGSRSVASILGLHDPGHARHSLGIYTMLEEMEYARSRGARWYYPGYVIPDLPGFDYKLRLGPTQFLDPDGRWRARAHPPLDSPDARRATARVQALQDALSARGVAYRHRIYPAFWLGHTALGDPRCLKGMSHLACDGSGTAGEHLVAEHLPDEDLFVAAWVSAMPDVDALEAVVPTADTEQRYERRVLLYERTLARSPFEHDIADIVRAACATP